MYNNTTPENSEKSTSKTDCRNLAKEDSSVNCVIVLAVHFCHMHTVVNFLGDKYCSVFDFTVTKHSKQSDTTEYVFVFCMYFAASVDIR